tara:strand:+ start:353 stop:1729 length:1377 start_codon:yes stop_codon:yes gene_type:complete
MLLDQDGKLKFINHACYYIESNKTILISDPWLEGLAFNNGWELLDKSSSNKNTIKELIKSGKKIYIWYSHEHSDHFSISFLIESFKAIKNLTVIFQSTLDKRVINYLNSKKIPFIEADDGNEIVLDSQLSIYIWSHKNGDSYSLITFKKFRILNLNDCIVNTKREAINISTKISKITKNIDFLFTQFGYANWLGNLEHKEIRSKAAQEKIIRILLQNNYLIPKIIIPFASFISFCSEENFYLNEQQNTPKIVKNSFLLKTIINKIIFLKPDDFINLNNDLDDLKTLELLSQNAICHWEKLFTSAKPLSLNINLIECDVLKKESKKFLKKVNKNFLFLPACLEFFKIIRPVYIFLNDLNEIICFSYIGNIKTLKEESWDIKINSEVLYHSLKYEYGFNTLKVNGKFKAKTMHSYKNFVYFFYFQDLLKENITFKNPIYLLKKIMQVSIIFIKNIVSFRI